jgi:hypothetical protein
MHGQLCSWCACACNIIRSVGICAAPDMVRCGAIVWPVGQQHNDHSDLQRDTRTQARARARARTHTRTSGVGPAGDRALRKPTPPHPRLSVSTYTTCGAFVLLVLTSTPPPRTAAPMVTKTIVVVPALAPTPAPPMVTGCLSEDTPRTAAVSCTMQVDFPRIPDALDFVQSGISRIRALNVHRTKHRLKPTPTPTHLGVG